MSKTRDRWRQQHKTELDGDKSWGLAIFLLDTFALNEVK